MIRDVEIKPATAQSIREFYPDGAPQSCYGWIATYKGKAACFAGFTVSRGGYMAFCDIKQNDAPKLTIWRTARAMFEKMKAMGVPMMAIYCDPENQKRGQAFVRRLGFKYIGMCNGAEIFSFTES
jgi:hypothetical protein